jgi:hypothetical protein
MDDERARMVRAMTYTFRPARRENVPLLLGVAGGTGSGKTMSALRIARGIANGHPFAGIDTEHGRMSHYADRFPELHTTDIVAPFRPERYTEAIAAGGKFLEAVPLANRVVIVDSSSHVWAGDGGCLDWQEELTGGDPKKNPQAWATVKKAHKKMVTQLLWMDCHVILCFRAEPKVDIVREGGQMKFVPKKGPTGLDGWLPIAEKMLPYELTASFLLMADAPGVPRPIKLEEDHKPFVPLDRPLDEYVGRALAEWASGSAPGMVRGESQAGAETRSVGDTGRGSGHLGGDTEAGLTVPGTPTGTSSVGEPQAGHSEVLAMHTSVSQAVERTEPASPTDILDLVTALVGASQRPDATAAAIENHAAAHPPEQHYAWLMAMAEKKGVVVAGGAS